MVKKKKMLKVKEDIAEVLTNKLQIMINRDAQVKWRGKKNFKQ
jgi:hypothetical protein